MNFIRTLKIGTKIYAVVGLLSVVAALISWRGIDALATYQADVQAMRLAADRSAHGLQVNGLIYAVVMDTRGLFMSRSPDEIEKYAKPMAANLRRIDELMQEWRRLLPPDRAASLDQASAHVREFVTFRTETIRLAREVGTADARTYSDNDTNRGNRQRLGQAIDQLAQANQQEIEDINRRLDERYRGSLSELIGIAVIGIAAGLILSFQVTARAIVRPLTALTSVMRVLATGDFDARVPGAKRADELGDMARAVRVFQDNGIEAQRVTALRAEEQAAREKRVAALEALTASFEGRIEQIVSAVSAASTELTGTSRTMASVAERTSGQALATASASEQASANVQTVAGASEELASSTSSIGQQVTRATETVDTALRQASAADANVQELADAAKKIGEVVSLINNIAQQTNLLALNATIEAARAGDAGKGFAVVAGEVKALAQQTAAATGEIHGQVEGMQSATGKMVETIRAITGTIGAITEVTTMVASAVEEQGAATQEIARNVQQAALGTQDAAANAVAVKDAASETGVAAQQVLSAAGSLGQEAGALRREVDQFLAGVRAA
ncbi:chemotaxis sensory transducer [Aliidongia dinghuensis]|uniref:Chemotaxis sensory transducer n=1 Tax=Aliidongia dinghuensis TaxID=1867774 RepID=A0A8J2YRC0_9PROT|nr:methyl-accepting chemotaxis protein [Aliidongia dinghuensis]GGF05636.1 chemotaxis sensory transducer [Aliidongia dinghuensis]